MTRDEWKRKWVEALRSGHYRQGKAMMYVNGCYCPLGVACAVYNKHSERPVPIEVEEWEGVGEVKRFATNLYFPPMQIMNAFGIEPDLAFALVDMNDSGIGFKDIADLLEDSIYTEIEA